MVAILAFDTSTERLHIGLAVDPSTWLHESDGGAGASSSLLPGLRRLLTDARIGLRDLDAIAYGRGPGAFTGLRTACSVAQGLGLGSNRPVLPLDTLMVVAEDARERSGESDVWVCMDARMDEIYAARYRWTGVAWKTVVAPALYTVEALQAYWRVDAPQTSAGTAPMAFGARLDVGNASLVAAARPGAAALLACAQTGWRRGAAVDAALALPLYLRDRVALTAAERAAATAGRPAR
jgi:tRNA threonylcarbamoyladenosine biosynthesis protein TsaB